MINGSMEKRLGVKSGLFLVQDGGICNKIPNFAILF